MKKFNNKINVTKSFLPPFEEYVKEIQKIWDFNWMTNNGPLHQELEEKLASFLQVANCALFTNGHSAIDIAIKTFQLSGEVITTPFTFASTTHAIVMNNLKPIFCDINMHDYTIDTDKIEELITDKTSAIIPVHVYGNPSDVVKIKEIADKHHLKVIYDAAHTFGVTINGVGIGNFGDTAMFSMHATKVFNTIEGGLLTFNNSELRAKFNLYKNFGITGPETVEAVGLNAKMCEFHAAMGLVNLRYLQGEIQKRKLIVERYIKNLSSIAGISLLHYRDDVEYNYAYFPIMLDERTFGISRDVLFDFLCARNVYPRKYFYPLVSDYECYKDQYDSKDTPNAKMAADQVMTLPLYGSLSSQIVDDICEVIAESRHNS